MPDDVKLAKTAEVSNRKTEITGQCCLTIINKVPKIGLTC
jgi:hypothetical protein